MLISLVQFVGVVLLLLGLYCSAWYYLRILAPFANFPSYRLDIRVLKWMLTEKHFLRFFLQRTSDLCKQSHSDDMCVMWLGRPFVFVYGEEAVKTLVDQSAAYDKPDVYKIFEFAVGQCIFTSNGARWKKQKKLTSAAFHLPATKDKIPIMNEVAETLVHQLSTLKNHTTDETANLMRIFSSRIFFESSLGLKDTIEINKIGEAVEMVLEFTPERILKPWLYWDIGIQLFPSGRKCLKACKEAYDTSKKILEDMKHALLSVQEANRTVEIDGEYNSRRPKLFGEILLEEHLKDPSFTMAEVLDEQNFFIIAAYHTLSSTMNWCLFHLGHQQDIQEKAYQEILSKTEHYIDYSSVCNLTYLENIIKETLRLYPIGPVLPRRLTKDVQHGKYKIPKNSNIVIFQYYLLRNPEIYPDPEKFHPERFAEKDSRMTQWNFFPFAEGIRSCPGKLFGMIQMKILLAHILRNFRIISLDRIEDVGASWNIIMVPTKSIRMQYIPRKSLVSN